MNEGHAALLAVELFREARETAIDAEAALEGVKRLCIFTTHTPVPVGHDRFAPALVDKVLGGEPLALGGQLKSGHRRTAQNRPKQQTLKPGVSCSATREG